MKNRVIFVALPHQLGEKLTYNLFQEIQSHVTCTQFNFILIKLSVMHFNACDFFICTLLIR